MRNLAASPTLLLFLRFDLLALFLGLLVDGFLHVFGALLIRLQRVERCGDRAGFAIGSRRFSGAGARARRRAGSAAASWLESRAGEVPSVPPDIAQARTGWHFGSFEAMRAGPDVLSCAHEQHAPMPGNCKAIPP
jgi:hypothetical protein